MIGLAAVVYLVGIPVAYRIALPYFWRAEQEKVWMFRSRDRAIGLAAIVTAVWPLAGPFLLIAEAADRILGWAADRIIGSDDQ